MKPNIIMLNKLLTENEKKYLLDLSKMPKFYNTGYETLQILYTRGVKTKDDMYNFLHPNLSNLSISSKMKDSDKFCKIVKESILNNENIAFYTDFDVDGITSGYVGTDGLQKYARLMGSTSKIYCYANNRFEEGYGITPGGVDDLVSKHSDISLIITTDNGIVAYDGVQRAKDLGLKIIVTDHHKEGTKSVNADAIIDPHQKDDYSDFKDLCGVGVIFKLLYMLYFLDELPIEEVYEYLDIVALGTVADLVPLVGDNRIFVAEGINRISNETNLSFKVLREVYDSLAKSDSAKIGKITEETLAFTYGPAFNSLSRMEGGIEDALSFLFEQDEEKKRLLAIKIFNTNIERKELTNSCNDIAYKKLKEMYPTDNDLPPIIIYEDDSISEGIIGLVATFIKDSFNKPAVVLTKHSKKIIENGKTITKQILKGSARSIEGFDITQSFENVKDTLIGFGGHTAAAGLSLEIDKLDDFIKAEYEYASKNITPEMCQPKIEVDFAFKISELTIDLVDELKKAAPFGMGFPKPKIGISDFVVDKNKYTIPDWFSPFCGTDHKTVRLLDKSGFVALMFRHREKFDEILNQYENLENIDQIPVKMIGTPRYSYNSYSKREKLEFFIENNYLYNQYFN